MFINELKDSLLSLIISNNVKLICTVLKVFKVIFKSKDDFFSAFSTLAFCCNNCFLYKVAVLNDKIDFLDYYLKWLL